MYLGLFGDLNFPGSVKSWSPGWLLPLPSSWGGAHGLQSGDNLNLHPCLSFLITTPYTCTILNLRPSLPICTKSCLDTLVTFKYIYSKKYILYQDSIQISIQINIQDNESFNNQYLPLPHKMLLQNECLYPSETCLLKPNPHCDSIWTLGSD